MHRIIKTANFRLVIFYAAIFTLSVVLLGFAMFMSIESRLEEQLRIHIITDTNQLIGDYNDDGLNELQHDIRERIKNNSTSRLRYYLSSPKGKIIFDRIDYLPETGWNKTVMRDGTKILILSTKLKDGYILGVGGELNIISEALTALRQVLLYCIILTIILSIIGGIIISKKFLARVDRFNKTMERIGQGQLSERIAVKGADDDFDQLAVKINQMLDRVEQLVANIKQVSTNVAHDLRTPLGHIRQRLEKLKEESPDKKQHGSINEIIALLDNSLSIFSSMLRIAEIESGSRKSGFTKLRLSDLIEKVVEAYIPVSEEKKKNIRTSIQKDVYFTGDSDLLSQLYANLIENSLIHTEEGTEIEITLAEKNGIISSSVSDNGIGIPESEILNITKAFYRIDKSRTTPGNGLGLSLVKAIAELHDINIRIKDNKSGFRIELQF